MSLRHAGARGMPGRGHCWNVQSCLRQQQAYVHLFSVCTGKRAFNLKLRLFTQIPQSGPNGSSVRAQSDYNRGQGRKVRACVANYAALAV